MSLKKDYRFKEKKALANGGSSARTVYFTRRPTD